MRLHIFLCRKLNKPFLRCSSHSGSLRITQDHSGLFRITQVTQDHSGLFRITQANQLNQNIPVNCDRGIDFIICVYGGWGFDKP